jgi:uroporphyrinogen-III synthase
MRILITRPPEDLPRTEERILELGHSVVCASLFTVTSIAQHDPGPADAVLLTSANAIRNCLPRLLPPLSRLPVFCVGDASEKAAREAGFTTVYSARGNASALALLVSNQVPAGSRLLHLAGKTRDSAPIAALESSYACEVLETYETRAVDTLPENAVAALRERKIDAVMHFSPRATRVFMDLIDAAMLGEVASEIQHLCISAKAVDPRCRIIRIASTPTLDAMLQTLSTNVETL